MDEKLKKKLNLDLMRYGIAETWLETLVEETEITTEQPEILENDIGTASDGTQYSKSLVNKYLTEKGFSFTQENVDLAAKMFSVNGNKFTQKNLKTVKHSDFDHIQDDEVITYLTYKIVEQLAKLNLNQNIMDYTIDVIMDKGGATNTNELRKSLEWHSERGWKLKSVFTNELGKNSSSVSIGSITSGVNSTVDQVILIYERPAFLNDKLAIKWRENFDKKN